MANLVILFSRPNWQAKGVKALFYQAVERFAVGRGSDRYRGAVVAE